MTQTTHAAGRSGVGRVAASWANVSRTARVLGRVFSGVVMAALVGTLCLLAFGYRPLVVHSGSMEPTLRVGDVIFAKPTPIDAIAVGDIVTFRSRDRSNELVTHRVRSLTERDGLLMVETRGDANNVSERWTAQGGQVARYAFRIPLVGRLVAALRLPSVRVALAASVAAFLIRVLLSVWRTPQGEESAGDDSRPGRSSAPVEEPGEEIAGLEGESGDGDESDILPSRRPVTRPKRPMEAGGVSPSLGSNAAPGRGRGLEGAEYEQVA